jgi:hypothetical protein
MIKIYTFAHKRPDFIELQLQSFRNKLKNDFEFIIFNNAHFDLNRKIYDEIHSICKSNNLQCFDIQNDAELVLRLQPLENVNLFNDDGTYTNSVIACAYPLCWAWEKYISKIDSKICIIDSDMFFIGEVNLDDELDKYDIMYMPQSRGRSGEVEYMWNGLIFMNLAAMPNKQSLNWWCGSCEGFSVDVGGHTFYYLREYGDKLKLFEFWIHYTGEDPECSFSPANYEKLSIGDRKIILHYRGGSNWDQKQPSYHIQKTIWLKKQLENGK